MKNKDRDILDVLHDAIEKPNAKLSQTEQERLLRLKDVYTHWLEHPLLTDLHIRNYLMTKYSLGKAMAYQDIALVKGVFGNVPLADKEFQRNRANYLLEMASAAAMAGDDKKAKSLIKTALAIAKVNRLEENVGEELPWEEIQPQDFSFSVNPEDIGIQKEPGIEEKAKKLLAQYSQEIDDK